MDLKKLSNVAEIAAKIMSEQLKGQQHKLDVDKDGKIEGEDLAKLRAAKQVKKEEVEQVNEADIEKTATGIKVYGSSYGNSQRARREQVKKSVDSAKGPKMKDLEAIEGEKKKKKFSEMVESYVEGGIKGLFEGWKKVKEEATNDEFKSELDKQQAKADGKAPQADVAKAAVQAVQSEETEYQFQKRQAEHHAKLGNKKREEYHREKMKDAEDFERYQSRFESAEDLVEYESKDGVYKHAAKPGRYGGSEKESDYVKGPSDKELNKNEYEALILKDEILAYDGHHYSEIEEGYAWIKPEVYLEVPEKFIPLSEKEIYFDDNKSNENIEWILINE